MPTHHSTLLVLRFFPYATVLLQLGGALWHYNVTKAEPQKTPNHNICGIKSYSPLLGGTPAEASTCMVCLVCAPSKLHAWGPLKIACLPPLAIPLSVEGI